MDEARERRIGKLLRTALHSQTGDHEAQAAFVRLLMILRAEGITYEEWDSFWRNNPRESTSDEAHDPTDNGHRAGGFSMPFGPYAGKTILEVIRDPKGRQWLDGMLARGGFPPYLRVIVREALRYWT